MHAVTLIPGDGTGPELADAARACLDATGVAIRWELHEAGAEAAERLGTPFPEETLASLRRTGVALKGPLASPPGGPNLAVLLRQELDLFACVRPCRHFPGVPSPFIRPAIDVTVVRENTEDLYLGAEFEARTFEAEALLEPVARKAGRRLKPGTAFSVKAFSESGCRRIVEFAFEHAIRHRRRRVTAVHKANIMKATDGMFLRIAREVAKEFRQVAFDDRLIDNVCLELVRDPSGLDVLVAPNLYGDILSDLAAGLAGGVGVTAGGNFGTRGALFEPLHGTGRKLRGKGKANPTALILAGVMLLRHLGEASAADRLEAAVARVLAGGREVTYDLKADRGDGVPTAAMVEAILRELRLG